MENQSEKRQTQTPGRIAEATTITQLNSLNHLNLSSIKPAEYNDVTLTEAEEKQAIRIAEREKGLQEISELREDETYIPHAIELTDDEKREALRIGRKNKLTRQRVEAYKMKLNREKQTEAYKAEQLIENIQKKGVRLTKDNRTIIWQLCLYFSGDQRFNGDLSRGLYLTGPVGCGKTFLMHHFRNNQQASYIVKSARELSYEYGKDGFDVLLKYRHKLQFSENSYGHDQYGLCIDDLGTDDYTGFFGTKMNVITEILLQRYDASLFQHTHITTNITGDQLEDIYGTRIASRRAEMFNTIAFPSSAIDMRKTHNQPAQTVTTNQ